MRVSGLVDLGDGKQLRLKSKINIGCLGGMLYVSMHIIEYTINFGSFISHKKGQGSVYATNI